MKKSSILCLAVLLALSLPQLASADVVISEIMYHPAANEAAEFLELYNSGGSAVNLESWCIDGIDFCFDAGATIGVGQYLVLASDATAFQAAYGFPPDHTFAGTLSNAGETLLLQDNALATVDEVAYDDQGEWPVTPDGLGPSCELIDPAQDNNTPRNWRAATAPAGHTAKALNSVAATGLPPWITNVVHSTGAPSTPLQVTAQVLAATAVDLIYRIDFGTEVTVSMLDDGLHNDGAAGDSVYGASIPGQPIKTLIRYRLVATGPTGAHENPRTDDTIDYRGTVILDPGASSNLPIFDWYIDPIDYQEALDHFETDITEPALLFYNGELHDNVQIRVRGQTSRTFPKKHWKFEFPQGHEFSAPDLGIPLVDEFNLHGNWSDKSHMREILGWETFEAAGSPSLMAFHIRLQQNGDFFGLYHFLEHPDSSWIERVGLDPDGARYKADDDCRVRSLANLPANYEKLTRLDENYSDLRETLLVPLNNYVGQQKRDFIFDGIDLPAQINYMAVTVLIHNNDHVSKNYYLYRDTLHSGRWHMQPWDLDLTFGRNFEHQVLNDTIWADDDVIAGRTNVSPSHPLFADSTHQKWDFRWNRCINALLAEPEVREMYLRRLRTLYDEILNTPVYEQRIDDLQPLIATEYASDFAEWGQYGTLQTLTQATNIIKNDYLTPRRVHLGTTHRVPGMIPTAQSVSPPIVINEIMYNPVGGSIHEFLELYNPSATEAVDLSEWTVEGIGWTIPAGTVILPHTYLVLVNDDPAFRAEYGGGRFIPGEYPTPLNNAGLNLVLRDRQNNLIDQVNYDDIPPWPTTPDGAGPSLELIDPALDNSDPANWAASLDPGGTPGASNSVNLPNGPPPELYVNEVLPVNATTVMDEANEFAPWLEIYNAEGTTVDLGGLALSNNINTPAQWVFPANTLLCAGCFLVVWADSEPGEGPLHTNFSLSPAGGTVYLWTAEAIEIDRLTYPALATDQAYGHLPDGAAAVEELFVPTPGAANQGEPTPVILNEYNAVSSTNFLEDNGTDTYWGRVAGNGGDWFELVIVRDHVDLRGYDLVITNNAGTVDETIDILTLTNDPIWSDLRAGTLITVSEELADDVSYNPLAGDWWINVRAADVGTGTYITAANFPVSNDRWQLTLRDALDEVVFGPAGEGVEPPSGIGSTEVCKLEEDPSAAITPFSSYRDGSTSTFGAPNRWNGGTSVQNFQPLRMLVGSIVSASLTTPAGGSVFQVGATVNLAATASSTNGTITQVEFFTNAGGGPVSRGVATTPPYNVNWVAGAAGTYNLTAVATDDFAVSTTSSAVSIRINAAPTVSLTNPASGASFLVGATVSLAANAADSDGSVAQVQFIANPGAISLGTDSAAPFTATTSSLPIGSYSVTAVATDNDGQATTSAPITVKIVGPLVFSDGFASGNGLAWSTRVGFGS